MWLFPKKEEPLNICQICVYASGIMSIINKTLKKDMFSRNPFDTCNIYIITCVLSAHAADHCVRALWARACT